MGGPDNGNGDDDWKDMTLDELLGPDPTSGGDKALLDELLGDQVDEKRYEDMSLDELLALDDPVPAPSKQKQKHKTATSQTPDRRVVDNALQAEGKPTKSSKKADESTRREQPSKSSGGAVKTPRANAGGARGPHVKVSYNDDLTLDE